MNVHATAYATRFCPRRRPEGAARGVLSRRPQCPQHTPAVDRTRGEQVEQHQPTPGAPGADRQASAPAARGLIGLDLSDPEPLRTPGRRPVPAPIRSRPAGRTSVHPGSDCAAAPRRSSPGRESGAVERVLRGGNLWVRHGRRQESGSGRIGRCRGLFRTSVRSGFDSLALPPAFAHHRLDLFLGALRLGKPYRSDESAGSARWLRLNPPEAFVLTNPLVCSLLVQRMRAVAWFVLLAPRSGPPRRDRRDSTAATRSDGSTIHVDSDEASA